MHRHIAVVHARLVHAAVRARQAIEACAASSHDRVRRRPGRLAGQLGQGTVEYVALILLVALVMAGVVAAMKGFKTDEGQALGDAILAKIKDAVTRVKF